MSKDNKQMLERIMDTLEDIFIRTDGQDCDMCKSICALARAALEEAGAALYTRTCKGNWEERW